MKINSINSQLYVKRHQSFGQDCDDSKSLERLARIENKIDTLSLNLENMAKSNYAQHRQLSKNTIEILRDCSRYHSNVSNERKAHDELYTSRDYPSFAPPKYSPFNEGCL